MKQVKVTKKSGLVLDQLEALWHMQDANPRPNAGILKTYVEYLTKAHANDSVNVKAKLRNATLRLMDGIASNTVSVECAEQKAKLIFGMLVELRMTNILDHAIDMQYALAVLGMNYALQNDNELSRLLMVDIDDGILQTRVQTSAADAPEPHTETKTGAEKAECRLSHQLATELFDMPWCTLIEPDLSSLVSVVQAIWVERPHMLPYLQTKAQTAERGHTQPLPDLS